MARTNIDIDDEACAAVMQQHGFVTKREAVNFALRQAVLEQLPLDEALTLRGSGFAFNNDEIEALSEARPGR